MHSFVESNCFPCQHWSGQGEKALCFRMSFHVPESRRVRHLTALVRIQLLRHFLSQEPPGLTATVLQGGKSPGAAAHHQPSGQHPPRGRPAMLTVLAASQGRWGAPSGTQRGNAKSRNIRDIIQTENCLVSIWIPKNILLGHIRWCEQKMTLIIAPQDSKTIRGGNKKIMVMHI